MAMKLDGALKLYIGLYVVCFLLTWLISVPMLIHVTPQSECLLFVTPRVQYGNPACESPCSNMYCIRDGITNNVSISACNIVGVIPIAVACCALVLIFLHIIQLRSLHAFLRKPGPHSSSYHNRPTHIFWRIVSLTSLVLQRDATTRNAKYEIASLREELLAYYSFQTAVDYPYRVQTLSTLYY